MSEVWNQAKEFKESQKWDESVRNDIIKWNSHREKWNEYSAFSYEHPIEEALKKQNEQGRFVKGEFIVNSYKLGNDKELLDLYGMEISDLNYVRRTHNKDMLRFQEFPYPSGQKVWLTYLPKKDKKRFPSRIQAFVKKHNLRVQQEYNDTFHLWDSSGKRVGLIESSSFHATTPELFELLGKEVYGLISNPRLMLTYEILKRAKKLGVKLKTCKMYFERVVDKSNGIDRLDFYFIPDTTNFDKYRWRNEHTSFIIPTPDVETVIVSYDTRNRQFSSIRGSFLQEKSILKQVEGLDRSIKNAVPRKGSVDDYNNPDIDEEYDKIMNHKPIEKELPDPKVEELQPELFEI